jgi:lipocalin
MLPTSAGFAVRPFPLGGTAKLAARRAHGPDMGPADTRDRSRSLGLRVPRSAATGGQLRSLPFVPCALERCRNAHPRHEGRRNDTIRVLERCRNAHPRHEGRRNDTIRVLERCRNAHPRHEGRRNDTIRVRERCRGSDRACRVSTTQGVRVCFVSGVTRDEARPRARSGARGRARPPAIARASSSGRGELGAWPFLEPFRIHRPDFRRRAQKRLSVQFRDVRICADAPDGRTHAGASGGRTMVIQLVRAARLTAGGVIA